MFCQAPSDDWLLAPKEFRVICHDAEDFLQSLPSESVDLVVTDPAYESIEKHRAIGTTTRLKDSEGSSNQWFPVFPNNRLEGLLRAIWWVLKPDSHAYIFCDWETAVTLEHDLDFLKFQYRHSGRYAFKVWNPIVWDKQFQGMGYHYRSRYELIMFLEKGKRKLNSLSIPNVLSFKRVWGKYPAEKPVDLLKVLIEQSSSRGDLVVDPFTGSGSTGEAALDLGRRFRGCDIIPASAALAEQRLARL